MESWAQQRKYEARFKLKVIQVAKESNNCATARKFNVTESHNSMFTFSQLSLHGYKLISLL